MADLRPSLPRFVALLGPITLFCATALAAPRAEAATCGFPDAYFTPAQQQCVDIGGSCCSQNAQCYADAGCNAYVTCALKCGQPSCPGCTPPTNPASTALVTAFGTCLGQSCASGAAGAAGAGGKGGAAGASGAAGKGGTGGAAGAGASAGAGGAAAGASGGGSGGATGGNGATSGASGNGTTTAGAGGHGASTAGAGGHCSASCASGCATDGSCLPDAPSGAAAPSNVGFCALSLPREGSAAVAILGALAALGGMSRRRRGSR